MKKNQKKQPKQSRDWWPRSAAHKIQQSRYIIWKC